MSGIRRTAWLCATIMALGMLAPTAGASAAVFPVNSSHDFPDAFTGDTVCADIHNHCTLRAAIEQANAQGDPDRVNLPPGQYALGVMDELTVSSSIVIEGTGTAVNTVIGTAMPPTRIFEITASGSLDLRDATVRDGVLADDGGGILADGSLTLRRVMVTNNEVFGETGGGIFATGDVLITDSTITGNRAGNGAGIGYTGGAGDTFTIARSTLSNNTAMSDFGGGLYVGSGARAEVTNSTVSRNSAANGGGIATFGNTTLNHATVAKNAGFAAGIQIGNPATVTLAATILDNPAGDNCSAFGTVASGGDNVENGNDCRLGAGDEPSTDPLLGPLQSNGGLTRTHAIAAGSPAHDAVPSGCPPPSTDQRGVARPQGPACDSGAYELVPSAPGGTLDLSLSARNKQKAKKLKVEVGCGDVECAVELKGRSKVPKRAATTAKAGKFKLKPKGVEVASGGTEVVRLKFKKHGRTARKIGRLLKRGGKSARRAKAIVEATATGAGATDTAERKIKLKR
ncbi:MAG: choice-of-anchor Q domain-containing protein [Gemmatimonadaceae bacterium]